MLNSFGFNSFRRDIVYEFNPKQFKFSFKMRSFKLLIIGLDFWPKYVCNNRLEKLRDKIELKTNQIINNIKSIKCLDLFIQFKPIFSKDLFDCVNNNDNIANNVEV